MTLAAAESPFWHVSPATALLAVAALTLYIASRAAADALAGDDPRRPGLRALGHCIPVAAAALVCLHPSMARFAGDGPGGRPQVAVGLIFSACVGALTLVLGVVSYISPAPPGASALPANRRAWPFVMPAALLALVAGFNGRLTWVHAVMLAVLGLVVMNLWVGGGPGDDRTDAGPPDGGGSHDPMRVSAAGVRWGPRLVQLVLALGLAFVGGWAAARGTGRAEETSRALTAVVLAGTVLGPLLTLPLLGGTAQVAERGNPGSALATLVAFALINLCAVLPVVILVHHALTAFSPEVIAAATQPAFAQPDELRAVPYPLIAWRVDTVILIVLGFALVPITLGRWSISRVEAGVLIFGYAFYLAMVAVLSTRRH